MALHGEGESALTLHVEQEGFSTSHTGLSGCLAFYAESARSHQSFALVSITAQLGAAVNSLHLAVCAFS